MFDSIELPLTVSDLCSQVDLEGSGTYEEQLDVIASPNPDERLLPRDPMPGTSEDQGQTPPLLPAGIAQSSTVTEEPSAEYSTDSDEYEGTECCSDDYRPAAVLTDMGKGFSRSCTKKHCKISDNV
jgi:hypothetical protein